MTVQPSVGEIADCIAAHPCDRDGDGHTRDDCPQARAVLALIGGRTEQEVLAQGWDEGAEFMSSDRFWHDNAREYNPYRSEEDRG